MRMYVQTMVEMECRRWIEKGVNVKYETRNNRNGYKAGALREGLKKQYVEYCEFVAIFDADFQPEEDFLWRTIPYLLDNSELALVQARWKFGKSSCPCKNCFVDLLIRSIKNHCNGKCYQEVHRMTGVQQPIGHFGIYNIDNTF